MRLLCLVAVLAAGIWLFAARPARTPAPSGAPAQAAAPASPADVPAAAAAREGRELPPGGPAEDPAGPGEPAAAEDDGQLLLPTGERVPALNGVRATVELLWPDDRPYAAITGISRQPNGLQWYVHADGSYSTTQMVYRSDLGRKAAMSLVASPGQVLDLVPEDDPPSQRDESSRLRE